MAVARDDSVIRGSLIAALILLVLSLAMNVFLYQWGSGEADSASAANTTATNANDKVREQQSQLDTLKKMLGVGTFSESEFEALATTDSGDPDIDAIAQTFVRDVGQMGSNVDPANRNYPAIPTFMINQMRDRNVQVTQRSDELTRVEDQAQNDVMIAEQAAADAKQAKDAMQNTLNERIAEFDDNRAEMKQTNAEMADTITNIERQFKSFRDKSTKLVSDQKKKEAKLKQRITEQTREINELRQTEFEVAQGEVTYVRNRLVQINRGSADGLRNGVVFGVLDADATRISNAEPKAKIEVIKVLRDHLAECRVIDAPALSDPIIPGDKVYSPFWAPGRTVKIALAGEIDIDNDRRPDNEVLRGMILRAGGRVVEEIDPSVRFLVLNEMSADDLSDSESGRQKATELSAKKAEAAENGVTVIPAWKLINYIQAISDAKTIPLGSAARREDFQPEANRGTNRRFLGAGVTDLYRDKDVYGDFQEKKEQENKEREKEYQDD